MSLDLKPGWLARQFSDLETPYSVAEFEALQWSDREGAGPHPSIYKLRATVDRLSAALKVAREAIEQAPHDSTSGRYGDPECGLLKDLSRVGNGPCDCWKREAIAAIDAALKP